MIVTFIFYNYITVVTSSGEIVYHRKFQHYRYKILSSVHPGLTTLTDKRLTSNHIIAQVYEIDKR